jgi:hypothetical protein
MSNQSPGRTWSLSVSNLIQHMKVELVQQVAGVGERFQTAMNMRRKNRMKIVMAIGEQRLS